MIFVQNDEKFEPAKVGKNGEIGKIMKKIPYYSLNKPS
jgi:hypothetical protein